VNLHLFLHDTLKNKVSPRLYVKENGIELVMLPGSKVPDMPQI
jgi:hypothetical protein